MSTADHISLVPEQKPEPRNIEAEQGLLGAVLVDNGTLDWVSHFLSPQDFYDPLHGRIYEACLNLHADGARADPFTLKAFFDGEAIGDFPVWQYLGRLTAAAAPPMACFEYGRTIKDLARRREMVSLAEWFGETVTGPNFKVADTISTVIGELDAMLAGMTERGRTLHTISEAAQDTVARLDGEARAATDTGLADLQKTLGGYFPGEYVILAARPGMGKSCFAPSTLLRSAKKNHGVMYFSLEMTGQALAERCLADLVWNSMTPIPYILIRRRELQSHDIDRLRTAAGSLQQLPFVIDDRQGLTVAEIASRARSQAEKMARAGSRLDVIAIDHLGKIRSSGRYAGNKVQETGEISGALAELAKELGCTVIALSQLSRQVEGRDNKRPVLADLRNSGDLEQDADVVMFLYRKAYYLEQMKCDDTEQEATRLDKLEASKNEMEIIVAKQRSGPNRTITAYCDMACNVVRDRF